LIYIKVFLWLTHQRLDYPENFWCNFRNWGWRCPHCRHPGSAPGISQFVKLL